MLKPVLETQTAENKRNFPLDDDCRLQYIITDCDMKLGEKIRYLREVEGTLRGLDREMSQLELARLIQKELGKSISQSYLSQIESGARPHLTNGTRMLLARFFKVHPGYLVDDPEGFQNELISDLGALEDKLDLWLIERRRAVPPRAGAASSAADGRASIRIRACAWCCWGRFWRIRGWPSA